MTGDWKPGDLAIVDYGTGSEVMMRDHWGWWSATTELSDSDDAVESIGPLAVIDPEDRQAVERLAANYERDEEPGETAINQMQAALREFAAPTPPRPNEPQGLGAVVEDRDGDLWVRNCPSDCEDGRLCIPWRRARDASTAEYSDITAVRKLSEGIEQP